MKDLTIKKTGFFRAINKHTKDYVDIPAVGGQGSDYRLSLFDYAHAWAGWAEWVPWISETVTPEFHYYAIYDKGKEDQAVCGVKLLPEYVKRIEGEDKRKHISIHVNLITNELVPTTEQEMLLKKIGVADIYRYINRETLL